MQIRPALVPERSGPAMPPRYSREDLSVRRIAADLLAIALSSLDGASRLTHPGESRRARQRGQAIIPEPRDRRVGSAQHLLR